jgi:hypothetical protein
MNVLDAVRKEINDEIERIKDDLCFSGIRDFAEYRHLCGVVNGLLRAASYVSTLNKQWEESDE